MGLIIVPMFFLMAGPLAPVILLSTVIPGPVGAAIGNFCGGIIEFFWMDIPEFFGTPLF